MLVRAVLGLGATRSNWGDAAAVSLAYYKFCWAQLSEIEISDRRRGSDRASTACRAMADAIASAVQAQADPAPRPRTSSWETVHAVYGSRANKVRYALLTIFGVGSLIVFIYFFARWSHRSSVLCKNQAACNERSVLDNPQN